jgi:hypothetical protein
MAQPSAPAVAPASSPIASPTPTPLPTPDGISLPTGRVASTAFVPRVSFVVPDGWRKQIDIPAYLVISPPGAGLARMWDGSTWSDAIRFYARPLAGPPDGGPEPLEGVGTDAKRLATWMHGRPQLTTTPLLKTTLAGLPAWTFDFGLSSSAGGLCGMPCVNLLNSADHSVSYQMGIEGPWQSRAWFVDAPDGSTVLVAVEDVDGSGLDADVERAQPVLDSLRIGG